MAADVTEESEQRWYDIEILIFSQGDNKDLMGEVWPEEFTINDIEDAIELQGIEGLSSVQEQAITKPVPFQLLPANTYQLSESATHLRRSKKHGVMLHAAWRQPGLPADKARSVHINDNLKELLLATGEKNRDQKVIPVVKSYIGTETAEALPMLDGTIKVVLSRYLHLHVDLRYNYLIDGGCEVVYPLSEKTEGAGFFEHDNSYLEDSTPDDGGTPWSPFDTSATDENSDSVCYQPMRLRESRRMRSKELHFLDHPLFGMLVLITPYEIPEAAPEPQEQLPESGGIKQPAENVTPDTIRRN